MSCPDCDMNFDDDGDFHCEGCPRIDTCGQFGPPWLPGPWHRDPEEGWTIAWYHAHMRDVHAPEKS